MKYATLSQLRNAAEFIAGMNQPAKTKIEKEWLDIAEWIEAKCNSAEKRGEKGMFTIYSVPNHYETDEIIEEIESCIKI